MGQPRVKNLVRQFFRVASRAFAQVTFPRRVVLLYHSIGGAAHSVSVSSFSEQMAYLADNVRVVTFDEMLSDAHPVADITCALTFDDGYANVYDKAFPILNRYKLPALIYLTTGAICDVEPELSYHCPGLFPAEEMLTWTMLSEMVKHGISVGSHLCHHKDMTLLSRVEAMAELRESHLIITGKLGVPCQHFAYPFGSFNKENIRWVSEAGYKSASTVQHRTVPLRFDAFRVPRMCVARIHMFEDFKAMLRGDLDYLRLVQKVRASLGMGYPVLVHDAKSIGSRWNR